jgi:transcriptional regulator with XRE-family HTH domain
LAGSGNRGTRLQRWLDAHGFTSAQLESASGIVRQTMRRIRSGHGVTQKTMRRIRGGAETLAGHSVQMEELFDLDAYGRGE